jgi:hypothetical protein
LEIHDDNMYTLKKSHPYYAQVQGQLLVTGTEFCDFVLFTKHDLHIERISPDHAYMNSMLLKLANFFRDYAAPYINRRKRNIPSPDPVLGTHEMSSGVTMSITLDHSS